MAKSEKRVDATKLIRGLRERLEGDLFAKADPTATMAEIRGDLQVLSEALFPYRDAAEIVGELVDLCRSLVELCCGLTDQIANIQGVGSDEGVRPAVDPPQ